MTVPVNDKILNVFFYQIGTTQTGRLTDGHRHTNRLTQTDRRTDGQTDRQIDEGADGRTGRQANVRVDRHMDEPTYKYILEFR